MGRQGLGLPTQEVVARGSHESKEMHIYIYIYIAGVIYVYIYIYTYIYRERERLVIPLLLLLSLLLLLLSLLLSGFAHSWSESLLHDRHLYTTTSKCLQCLMKLMYTIF